LIPDADDEPLDETRWPALPESDWLFTATVEPMLIVESSTATIIEVNPPAAVLFRETAAALLGAALPAVFEPSSGATIEACVAIAQVVGNAETLGVQARSGGPEISARLSLFRASRGSYLLVRLASQSATAANDGHSAAESIVFQAIDSAQVGFLMTDCRFRIDYANREFTEMIEIESHADVRGASLLRWLALSDEDLLKLRMQLLERQAVTRLTSQLSSRRGDPRPVEVYAVAVPAGGETCWGFSVCERTRFN
jgi:PAS domain-containing protein